MSSAEIHREPFIHLVDLAYDRALIAWGAFYFERTERSRREIVDDEQLRAKVGRRTCIGATAEPFGHATVKVLTTDGEVAAEISTDERAWVWVEGLEPELTTAIAWSRR
jgi:tartrate-resistant acid phosphatase type 5